MASFSDTAFSTSAFSTSAFDFGTVVTTVIDVFSDEEPHRRHKRRKEKLHDDLLAAYNKTFGITVPQETETVEMVAAIEENLPQIRKTTHLEVERRVLERLLKEHERIREQEDEWDMDALLALAHVIQ